MRWFKHMTDASHDEALAEIEHQFGLAGLGRWWKLVEAVAAQMHGDDTCEVTYRWRKWEKILTARRQQLRSYLVATQQLRLCCVTWDDQQMTCRIPKLLELRDNHTRNLQAAGKSLVPKKEKEKKNKRVSVSGPLSGSVELPEWLPAPLWQEWLQDRKDRKKPMTRRAEKLAIRKLDEYRQEGHSPRTVIEHSIAQGYQGLFPPKDGANGSRAADGRRHETAI